MDSFHSVANVFVLTMYWIVTASIRFKGFHLCLMTSGAIMLASLGFRVILPGILEGFALLIDFFPDCSCLGFVLNCLDWIYRLWLFVMELWSSSSNTSSSYSQSELSLSLGWRVVVCKSGSRSI